MNSLLIMFYTAPHAPKYVKNLTILADPINTQKSGKITQILDITHLVLTNNVSMSQFLNRMIDSLHGVNKDIILNLHIKNLLKEGHIPLVDKLIKLKNIDRSVFIGAGDSDRSVSEVAAKL